MNESILKGQWNTLKGKVKEAWGDLTDDEVAKIEGNYDSLVGSVQKKYGYTQEKSREAVNDFLKKYKS